MGSSEHRTGARSVWVLQHVHVRGEDDEDTKFIGVYSSEQLGRATIAMLSTQPGFEKQPQGFCLEELELDGTRWQVGFVLPEAARALLEATAGGGAAEIERPGGEDGNSTLWTLHHVLVLDEDEDEEDVKMIGIYSSIEHGKAAIELLSTKPGFADSVRGFQLSRCRLDRTGWEEGFVTMTRDD